MENVGELIKQLCVQLREGNVMTGEENKESQNKTQDNNLTLLLGYDRKTKANV